LLRETFDVVEARAADDADAMIAHEIAPLFWLRH
jgi:hypothetical protein